MTRWTVCSLILKRSGCIVHMQWVMLGSIKAGRLAPFKGMVWRRLALYQSSIQVKPAMRG